MTERLQAAAKALAQALEAREKADLRLCRALDAVDAARASVEDAHASVRSAQNELQDAEAEAEAAPPPPGAVGVSAGNASVLIVEGANNNGME